MSRDGYDGLTPTNTAVVERIRADKEHGASALAREAARALADIASETGNPIERLDRAHRLAHALAQARPSMAAIANTVSHLWSVASSRSGDAETRLAALRSEAHAVDANWSAAVAGMTTWAREAIAGPVYTLSRSGSVEQTLVNVARERAGADPLRVIVSESRPGGEGIALATALGAVGALVTLAPDTACATLIDEAALVIVGADSVRGDGSVVNKVGTRMLAQVAHAARKPVYALAERWKITPVSYPLALEEASSEALLPEPVAGVTPRAMIFDVTPAMLITGIVMEAGHVDAATIARMAREAECEYQALTRL